MRPINPPTLRNAPVIQTMATVPPPTLMALLERIEVANRSAAESRLLHYLRRCRHIGYEPPAELLRLACDQLRRKRVGRSTLPSS